MPALFTPTELKAHKQKLSALENKRQKLDRNDNTAWRKLWDEQDAINKAHQIETIRRAQARPNDFLNGLLVLVGNRGASYLEFDTAFDHSTDPKVTKEIIAANTPEARRNLYTILRALTEVPKSWATSAFCRFLRGTGKQKDAKYHGAGTFGVRYGWKEQEVEQICRIITSRGMYADCLMSYADVADEIHNADPDFEIVDYHTTFTATRVERDVTFLNTLCKLLEGQGLGPVPTPAPVKPKKARKIKVFKSGDIVRKKDLRDLPLPAHVRVAIERRATFDDPWTEDSLELVVIGLNDGGYFEYAVVTPNAKTAYKESEYCSTKRKDFIDGATFLGKWTGEIAKKKIVSLKFSYRKKGSPY